MKDKIYLFLGFLILFSLSCKESEEKILGKDWKLEADRVFYHRKSNFGVTTFQDKLWVVGGAKEYVNNSDDIYFSDNGIKWEKVPTPSPFSARRTLNLVTFKNKMWLIGGQQEQDSTAYIWSSEDGINWKKEVEEVPFGRRYNETVFVFKDKLWLAGGIKREEIDPINDVWSSLDGVNWVQEKEAAAFPPRTNAQVQEKDGKLWLVGGVDYDNILPYLDVWSSEDGINWVEVNTNGLNSQPRIGHRLIVHEDELWLIGGEEVRPHPGKLRSDVWSSEDGANWKLVTKSAQFYSKKNHGAASFKGKMFVFGGRSYFNSSDVWSSK